MDILLASEGERAVDVALEVLLMRRLLAKQSYATGGGCGPTIYSEGGVLS